MNKALPTVLYRFDKPSDQQNFSTAFQDHFELITCNCDEQAQRYLEQDDSSITSLVLDQDLVNDDLAKFCKRVNSNIQTLQLHQNIALDEIVTLLEAKSIDKCFAKPYDINLLRSDIYTHSLGLYKDTELGFASLGEKEQPIALIVDDEHIATKFLSKQLKKLDCPCKILVANNAEQAMPLIREHQSNLAIIISDQRMPGMQGNQLLAEVQQYCPYTIRMLTSAYEEVDIALKAVNEGNISRYIKKPWKAKDINALITLALLEHKEKKDKAKLIHQGAMEAYQQVVNTRRSLLTQALQRTVTPLSDKEALNDFFECLLSLPTLPSSSASLRASRESNIEEELVNEVEQLFTVRLASLSKLQDIDSKRIADTLITLLSTLQQDGVRKNLLMKGSPEQDLGNEVIENLEILLHSSGLDLSDLEISRETEGAAIQTRQGAEISMYRHLLSSQLQVNEQMLRQQCAFFYIFLAFRTLGFPLQIAIRGQKFTLKIILFTDASAPMTRSTVVELS